ncbi:GntR family transcriptional regulator [Anaerococcus sp. AGMB09787]|uniref:GntR family transcriptional regulator n=1 Tax=Anaerococcus sp. AGMB09787 TaxID=2922869 RepID=UPI001FAF3A93|nr:GntR family transcriptional regulator [Anaerococcus sp. AGMB09787]
MFDLNYNSNTPLYMQIVEQTKSLLAAGILKEGDKFPSVRELAKILTINQTTVSKAFKELDKIGLIETRPGVGTFIKIDKGKIVNDKGKFEKNLIEDFKQAIFLGYSKDELSDLFSRCERMIDENKG